MSEELKNNAAVEAAEQSEKAAAPAKKCKKWPIVLGVVVVVLVAAVAGLWIWHEQPSFCAAICHTPMDPYLATYEAEPGQANTDKWGNEVADAAGMTAALHRAEAGTTCLDCHVPTLSEQISEGMSWLASDYDVYTNDTYGLVLAERADTDLVAASGKTADEFCLNESCHNMTREELAASTADKDFNPHVERHGVTACTDCHKAHRASVLVCASCHTKNTLPDGWITPAQEKKLTLVEE